MRQKCGEKFCRYSSFKFQGKWPQDISGKILDILNSTPNKVPALLQLWEVMGPNQILGRHNLKAWQFSGSSLRFRGRTSQGNIVIFPSFQGFPPEATQGKQRANPSFLTTTQEQKIIASVLTTSQKEERTSTRSSVFYRHLESQL